MTMNPSKSFQCLPASEAAAMIRSGKKPVIFDVRDIKDYQQGHIADAAHLAESRLMAWFGRLDKKQAIIIYCYKGHASQTFAQMFADFKFTRVFSVDGGYSSLATALAEGPA
jgi:rhodanese-related sulfurtransferase